MVELPTGENVLIFSVNEKNTTSNKSSLQGLDSLSAF